MKIHIEHLQKIIENVWFCIKFGYSAAKKYYIYKCIILFLGIIIPFINLLAWKNMLNLLGKWGGGFDIFLNLTIYIVMKTGGDIINIANEYVNARYIDELQIYIDNIMMQKASRMDLSFYDSASMGDKLRYIRNSYNTVNKTIWIVLGMISKILNIIITLIIAFTYKWWIGILTLLLLIPDIKNNKSYTIKQLNIEKKYIRENRLKEYYYNIIFDNNAQFEIKLNCIDKYFLDRYKKIWEQLFKINIKFDLKHKSISTITYLLSICSELLVLVLSIIDVLQDEIGVGDIQYNINIISRLRNQFSSLLYDINQFCVCSVRLDELKEFVKLEPTIEKSGNMVPPKNATIKFCNVSFKYPNSDCYVLRNCSFIIMPNERVGLIGTNGSGKSTIIKLLLRFYDPQEGMITLNDVDIKNFDVYEVRKLFSILFQDYVTYCLPLREIIALSEFGERYNINKLEKTCKMSGFDKIISSWHEGFDSVIGRYYSDKGKDLSGGQWQILGLTRTYFRESEFIILDEPSAALDPIYEDKIFNDLYIKYKVNNTLTISHRLSNTTMADKILVLDDGRIIEQGTHMELIKLNGVYAYLFQLQAKKYDINIYY